MVYDGKSSYLYDPDGHVCAVSTAAYTGGVQMIQYLYDASGERVAKGTITSWSCDQTTSGFAMTNQYFRGPGGEQMTELTVASGTTTPAWLHTNIYAGGTLVATYENDNLGPHFRFSDWLGTMRAQTNYAGVTEKPAPACPSETRPLATPPQSSSSPAKKETQNRDSTTSGLDTTPAIWAGGCPRIGVQNKTRFRMQS